ncbi:ATP-binding protein [Duganella sp. S19_KUP01_CR8]|uniref:ATP-binding protein n=1 Tax=Duganella sp. S19_KUP01_CR8 TaxID=3025502 RepID=UPI002FCD917D
MNSSKQRHPVQRTFCDLSEEEIADVERASLLRTHVGWSRAYGWDTLLKSQRVLIVSEAGAGKSHECRAQQQTLWHRDEPAFYFDLAELATRNLRDLLSGPEEVRLNAWLAAQSDVATFFLDSIDELKLTLGSFETALKQLSKVISGQLARVRIVITSRPIAVDQQLIRQYLPVPDPVTLAPSGDSFAEIAMGRRPRGHNQQQQGAVPAWRNVTLMPLSDEQISDIAALENIPDAKALLADIHARDAESFARRPQDLIELCADWREHRSIRSHRDQVVQNIRVKLKPRISPKEATELTPAKALEGASRLALAALLTRKLTIRLSLEADKGGEPGTALDPALVLPDWNQAEREVLLERALFGFASYGRVKFHHRSVVEFLAAVRLDDRLRQGMPIKAAKRLLFADTPEGVRVVRPTLMPVAAWLAASQPSIFSEVREYEPDVLLNHADPGSLTDSQRVDALNAYVRVYGKGGWRGMSVPQVQVHRFASPELAEHVLELWRSGIENEEVRELLLELVGAGRMSACADIAYAVSTDVASTRGERREAISALAALGDPRVQLIVQSIVDEPALWPDLLVRDVVVRLFPQHLTPSELCTILKDLPAPVGPIGDLEWLLPRNIAELEFAPDYLPALQVGLNTLVTEGLTWKENNWTHLVSPRPLILPMLAAVCLRLIRGSQTDVGVLRSAMISLRLKSEDSATNDSLTDLRKVLGDVAAPLRETIFWADDAFCEGFYPQTDPWKRLVRILHDGALDLNVAQDARWVTCILSDPDRPLPERMMALHLLIHRLWDQVGNSHEYVKGLEQYVDGSPELIEIIDQHLAPKELDPETVELEERLAKQRQAAQHTEAQNHAAWVAFWREVGEHPDTAFSSEREDSTAWNLWRAMQQTGDRSRASGWNRRFIEQYFGKEVADRLRVAMCSIWRRERPTLRYERPVEQRGEFLSRWQLGLAAITAEAEDPAWISKLSVAEVELAVRYAPIELNGFPAWLESLAKEYPAEVERTLGPDLSAELDEIAAQSFFGFLLQNVSHSPAVVMQLFLPRLRSWLDMHIGQRRDGEAEAASLARLQSVLDILIEHGGQEMQQHVCCLAKDQLKVTKNCLLTKNWLATLMRLDPIAGTDELERALTATEPVMADRGIDIFGSMFGDRHGNLMLDLRWTEFTPTLLLRLLRLAYQHVRPVDDEIHEGAYSPEIRDHAETGRNVLLNAILETKGREAWAVKISMFADPLFAHFRDRLALLAREKAAEEVDGASFGESAVAVFDQYGELSPTTRDDMFAVMVDRLDDLDDLLLQDVSPRAAWVLINDEKVMRQQIALQLRSASNEVYTVDQEAVTADEKETDIRLRAMSGQQATIELKLGQNGWSGRDLYDTLKNQLVNKYMAADSCRSGCLLVTVPEDRTWEHPEKPGEMLDIAGLRTMLNAQATKIMEEMAGSLRLAIKVLDLRPRLAAEAAGKISAKRNPKATPKAKAAPKGKPGVSAKPAAKVKSAIKTK